MRALTCVLVVATAAAAAVSARKQLCGEITNCDECYRGAETTDCGWCAAPPGSGEVGFACVPTVTFTDTCNHGANFVQCPGSQRPPVSEAPPPPTRHARFPTPPPPTRYPTPPPGISGGGGGGGAGGSGEPDCRHMYNCGFPDRGVCVADGECACNEGYSPDADVGCVPSFHRAHHTPTGLLVAVVVGAVALVFCVCVICVLAFVIAKRRRHAEHYGRFQK
eukprot:CAMPEP_0198319306 /NCGR_PEP_ID=MMETSP1450-20131203/8467_1 /TAXON_ID=753684 ORGANISM="Madagascaria erythrocladiodes, Strain CCMP3234" /NCGR_SAMPLE_ID=MMETSP1450 /ASSEMBLY_ACC=CAM_ASM_001115 /LENGTH=220 /DNA_ID=CAMNT_0044022673 /DNA_START=99 /DNA_END=761 /DNA_ORIENTATION=+